MAKLTELEHLQCQVAEDWPLSEQERSRICELLGDTMRIDTLERLLACVVSENSGEWGEVLIRFDGIREGIGKPCPSYCIGTCPGMGSVCETHFQEAHPNLRAAIDAATAAEDDDQ